MTKILIRRYYFKIKDINYKLVVNILLARVNMDLLTYRLSALMNQVAENQIAELIDRDKIQQQRLMEKEQRSKMLSYKTSESFFQVKHHRNTSIRNMIAAKKKEEERKAEQDANNAEKIKKVATLSTIWGSKKNLDKNNEKTNPKGPSTSAMTNKFQKAARFAALMSTVKQNRDLCTCESLDAKCKIHDS